MSSLVNHQYSTSTAMLSSTAKHHIKANECIDSWPEAVSECFRSPKVYNLYCTIQLNAKNL